jgi:hypothetical protein
MTGTMPPRQVFLPILGLILFFFATVFSFARQQPAQVPAPASPRANLSYGSFAAPPPAGSQEKAKTPPPKESDGDYVGSETCVTCHDDQNRRFKNTVMGKAMLGNPHTPEEARGCESCHGPGRAHVEAGGGKETIPIRYYLYGLQKDISHNYGFDADYAFSNHVTLYAEYSREYYYQRMITRYRPPPSGVQTILTCTGCDSANNDWQSTASDPVDVYSVGVDLYVGKKAYFTTYYALSAGKGNVVSQFLGDLTVVAGADTFLRTGTNAATPYPETVDRSHEVVGVIFKYKLIDRLTPRIG